LWITVIGLLNLGQIAILSSFIGDAKAWALFNSVPLMLAWLGLTVLLVVGFAAFPRLVRKPGLLLMHLGALVLLLGGMSGSKAGMKVLDSWKDHKRIYKGYMTLSDGERLKDVSDAMGNQFDELPFHVESRKFWMEYHPYQRKLTVLTSKARKTGRWQKGKEKEDYDSDSKRFKFEVGNWQDLPLVDGVEIRVTEFEIQDPVTQPMLLVTADDGHGHDVKPVEVGPAVPGQTLEVPMPHNAKLLCEVQQVTMSRWAPHPMDPRQRYLHPDPKGTIPTALVNLTEFGGTIHAYTKPIAEATGQAGMHARLRYVKQADTLAETGKQWDGPVVVALPPGMDKQVVPAKAGSEFTFMSGRGRTVIGRVKRILHVALESAPAADPTAPAPKELAIVEANTPGAEPMAEIDLLTMRGRVQAPTPGVASQTTAKDEGPITLRYIPADDPTKTKGLQRPIITFEAKRGAKFGRKTITIHKGRPSQEVRLDFLYDTHDAWLAAGAPRIYAADEPPTKDYVSRLVIHHNGKEVATKDIEVNHPLKYGGYRFYQSDWDHGDLSYTFITVKSDAGWPLAFVGMILLMAGAFLQFWFIPIIKAARGRSPGQDVAPVNVPGMPPLPDPSDAGDEGDA